MALVRDLSKAQLSFQVADRGIDEFEVLRFRGTEGLSQLYRFEIELGCAATQVEFNGIVGKPAVLSINTDYGTRWFHGLIARFELTGQQEDRIYFRAELVPSVWLLSHRHGCHIFQNKTVPEIIADVLERGGIPSDRYTLDVQRTYKPRVYCVKYRETDLNFICRLMEEEGIRYYFQQTAEAHTLIMTDGPATAYTPITGDPKLPYQIPTGLRVEEEHVFAYRLSQSVRSGAVVLNDFFFENPKLNLEGASDCGRDTDLEFFDFPGEYSEQSTGVELATLRAEEFEAGRTIGVGQSNSPRMCAGLKFELTEHPNGVDGEYLITSVCHEGKQSTAQTSTAQLGRSGLLDANVQSSLLAARQDQDSNIRNLAEALLQIISRMKSGDATANRALTNWLYHAGQVSRDQGSTALATGGSPVGAMALPNLLDDLAQAGIVEHDAPVYQCRFECIPAAITYRPARVTPWPQMRGTQTARVVGPQSEEIYTDEYGRIKVQFSWDRQGKHDENSSCWIRVSQSMAGGGYGSLFLPRVGQEVVVDFLEGNPDEPLVVGRVYNADHMPPYKLPDEKTKSVIKSHTSKGGGGNNEIRFEDLKDKEQLFIQAQRQMDTRVKANHYHTVGASYELHVGSDKGDEAVGEYRQLIKEHKQVHVEGELRTHVAKDESRTIDGMVSLKVGGTCSVDVGRDMVEKFGAAHKHEVAMNYALKALGVKIEGSTGIELKCGGSSIVLTPGAIFISAPLVNINSGSGPPVSPVTAQATSPTAVEDPEEADKSDPGKDTSYTGGQEIPPAVATTEVPGGEFEPTETEETETTWIAIELVDEFGDPIPGQKYEITTPDGVIKKGTTDANGKAKVSGIDPGECEIKFPELDIEAVKKKT